jgi:colanic acid/amylovoran biosynthesis glycosyltransferase
MMKILMVGHFFPQRAETFILEQANSLVELGHDVTILVLLGGDPTAYDERSRRNGIPERVVDGTVFGKAIGGRLLPTLLGGIKSLFLHPRALRFGRHGTYAVRGQLAAAVGGIGSLGRFDAIFAFFGPAGVSAECLRDIGLIEGPIVTSFLGYDVTREIQIKGKSFYTRLFREGAEFNPNSNFLRSLLLANAAPEDRTRVHRLGINLDQFGFVDRSEAGTGPVLIAAVGRLVEKKGFEYLIEAAGLLRDRGTNFRIELAGSGPLEAELAARIKAMDLTDHITMLGWSTPEEVVALLQRAEIFAVPSVVAADGDQEGLPLTLLEASASGLPIVGTRHSGIPEAVIDGKTGSLVDERDARGLAAALQRLCDDPGWRLEAGQNARDLVETSFSAQIQGLKLEEILMNAAGRE